MSDSPQPLESWPRPQYEKGGGTPFLYYVVFGTFDGAMTLSRSSYRCDGPPAGPQITKLSATEHGSYRDGLLDGFLWDTLQQEDPNLAKAIEHSSDMIVVHGEPDDASTLDYLRDAVGFLTCLLDCGAVCIYDPQMFMWWTPDEWRSRIFDPAAPVPRHHVVILTSPEENGSNKTWFHTRGMRKFGRPDLSLHNVEDRDADAIIDLFERFIEMQALGHVVPQGEAVRIEGLPALTCRHAGDLEDPDFDNVHIELDWPSE